MAGILLAAPLAPAFAQTAADDADTIVVEAQRSGAPMWEVTRGDSTVLLVGAIAEIPTATPWRPAGLERAARRADSIILETKVGFSVGAMFKVMFNMGKLLNLPKGKTSADYLSSDQQRRLDALEQATGKSFDRRSFLIAAHQLLRGQLKYSEDAKSDVSDIVRDAADKARIPIRPVGRLKGSELLDELFKAPPATHVPCLDKAMAAVEAGQPIVLERGLAWTRFDIPAVMNSPLEVALGSCWPWTDVRFGPELRGQWIAQIGEALNRKGVTLAVVPLNVLAEQGGVLDRLKAQGEDVSGPQWRAAGLQSR